MSFKTRRYGNRSSGGVFASIGCGEVILAYLAFLAALYSVHGYTLDYGISQLANRPVQVARWQKIISLPFVGSGTVSILPALMWVYDTNVQDCPVDSMTGQVLPSESNGRCDTPPALRLR